MSIPPNFRYSNPPQGTPPVHDDTAARKSLQLADTRDNKIANLIAVSYDNSQRTIDVYNLSFRSPVIPTVLAASSREGKIIWRKDNKSRYTIIM
jgi:hypothetical protein